MGSVRRAGSEVEEERRVALCSQLPKPRDGAIGHVLGEVIALVRRPVRLDLSRPLDQARRVLIGLPADEAEEMLEAAAGRPPIERPGRTALPVGHLMALA